MQQNIKKLDMEEKIKTMKRIKYNAIKNKII